MHTIAINLKQEIADEAQGLCTESAWTRFVETALRFSRLQHVSLLRKAECSGLIREPAFVEITDAIFKPLIEVGKLVCSSESKDGGTVYTHRDTVNPKLKKARDEAAESTEGGS